MSGDPVDERNDDQIHQAMKEAKELIRMLESTSVRQLDVKAGAFQIRIERRPGEAATHVVSAPAAAAVASEQPVEPGLHPVRAPLVGTFYHASSPGAKPFVEKGSRVERGQTLGIIETMKVMNEIASDCAGVVVEILVPNGQAVQFDEPLLTIDPGS